MSCESGTTPDRLEVTIIGVVASAFWPCENCANIDDTYILEPAGTFGSGPCVYSGVFEVTACGGSCSLTLTATIYSHSVVVVLYVDCGEGVAFGATWDVEHSAPVDCEFNALELSRFPSATFYCQVPETITLSALND